MRLPRVRFTVRTMMVAVAVIGFGLGGGIWVVEMNRRASHYRQTAAALGRREAEARREQQQRLQFAATLSGRAVMPQSQESARNAAGLAEYHCRIAGQRGQDAEEYARLRRQYERAAARPWLPIDSDRPPP